MVHFFGIFGPGKLARRAEDEAPAKANFFGGVPEAAVFSVPMSRAEQEACFLQGKAPEPDVTETEEERHDALAVK